MLTFPSHTSENRNDECLRLTFPLEAVEVNHLLASHLHDESSGRFSLPILLMTAGLWVQINQLCNMNMKFAALLLFVDVMSAVYDEIDRAQHSAGESR